MVHPLVALARRAIENYVTSGRVIEPPSDLQLDDLPPQAAAFVTLHTSSGALRGCVGTIVPTAPSLAEQVIQEAVAAATTDPRFLPVQANEVPELEIHVDVLSTPEQITSVEDLDPSRYGVIVEADERRGLLLPDLEGVDEVDQQVSLTMQKAGILQDETVTLYRFTVTRLT